MLGSRRSLFEWRHKEARSEEGQGSVEMLFFIMGILLIITGILYFGRVLYSDIAVQMAAYDGAVQRSRRWTAPAGRTRPVRRPMLPWTVGS